MAKIPVAGTYAVVDGTITFTPTNDLPNDVVVEVTLNSDIRGTENERLAAPVTFSFTTIAGE